MNNLLKLMGLGILLMMTGCATTGAATSDTGATNPAPAESTTAGVPIFQATDINGETFDLSAHIGSEVVFISFWATWCEPCKTEMPLIQQLHDDFGSKGLKVLSVSLDGPDTVSGVEPYIQTQGYTFQVVVDEDTSIAQAINPRTVAPFTVILAKDGQVAKTIEGFQLSESEHIIATVKDLLGLGG